MGYIQSILAIDDDPDALQILSEYLRLEGYKVIAASDGASGVQMLAQNEVQLVITDLNMPGLTGMDVIDIVRKNHPDMQIVVVTGYGTMETVLEALHKGAVDYLSKPYLLEVLKLSLRKAERQIAIDRQLAEASAQSVKPGIDELLLDLPIAVALIHADGKLDNQNSEMHDLIGNWRNDSPEVLTVPQARRLDQLLISEEDGASLLLEIADQERAIEFTICHVSGYIHRILLADEITYHPNPERENSDFLVLLSPMGSLLWASPLAVELFDLSQESEEDIQLSEHVGECLGSELRDLINADLPLTGTRTWLSAFQGFQGENQEFEVVATPLLDDHDRRLAYVLCFRIPDQPRSNLSYYRRRSAGRDRLMLYTDARGRVKEISQALLERLQLSNHDVTKPMLSSFIEEGGDNTVHFLEGSQPTLDLFARSASDGGEVLEFHDAQTLPLASRLEKQKEKLLSTSSLLTHLLSEAGADERADLRRRLDDVASTLVDVGYFRKAALFLRVHDDVLGWGFSGHNEETCEALRSDALWMDTCESEGGTLLNDSGARFYCPSSSIMPEMWQPGCLLVFPIINRHQEVVGRLCLEDNISCALPTSGQLKIIELLLQQVNQAIDELELEHRVARSEARYRDLYENARYSILIVDLENGRILDVNREAEALTGYSGEELTKKRIWEIRSREFQDDARKNWLKTVRGESSSFENVPLMRKDGSTIYVEYDCMFTVFNGRQVVQSFYRDVTEKQALEYSLIQSQKLAGLGQLSAGIAHELRNPLGIINSSLFFVNSTLEKSEAGISTQVSKHLGIIKNEVVRSRKIIENLLSFSRVSNQDYELIDLNDLLKVTLDLVKKELLVNNIRLVTELSDSEPFYLNLDELKQAFLNILLNATQAMPDGGVLSIRTGLTNGRVCLSFEDSGSGISKKDLSNVMNPFFTTKDPGAGTGLGLSLTHSFIRRAGGDLSIESEEGIGTTVRIWLPIKN